jgi:intracellular septation protein A
MDLLVLHADIHLDQHQLLKMLSFFRCMVFGFIVKNQLSKGVWVYFWVFDSIPLIYLSISVSILLFLSLLLCSTA